MYLYAISADMWANPQAETGGVNGVLSSNLFKESGSIVPPVHCTSVRDQPITEKILGLAGLNQISGRLA